LETSGAEHDDKDIGNNSSAMQKRSWTTDVSPRLHTADVTLMVFTLCNSLRIVAYVPQIVKAATDKTGAKAISYTTWGLSLISNISTAAYASVNKGDWAMAAAIFLRNGVGCIAIIAVAAWQRAKSHQRTTRLDTKVIPLIFGRAWTRAYALRWHATQCRRSVASTSGPPDC
jgi:hypothetical protein